jgi:hypothetical protein
MTKIIFLDVDGVLNWNGTEDIIDGFTGLDPALIANFNKIIEAHPDAKIVVSSTWRKCVPFMTAYKDFEGLKRLFASRGLKGEIIGHTPIRFSGSNRGGEIRDWLEGYETELGEKVSYVVLDDDTRGMRGWSHEKYDGTDESGEDIYRTVLARDLRSNHVVTVDYGIWDDGEKIWKASGLTEERAQVAIDVLNGKLVEVSDP